MDSQELMDRYADLALRVGVNLQPGQRLLITGLVENAPMIRAIAEKAYAAGAGHVDVRYSDQHVKRSMVMHADDETLTWTPPYLLKQTQDLADDKGATIWVSGDPEPDLLADLDQKRVGAARMLELQDLGTKLLNERATAWSIVAYPTAGWAETVFGAPDTDKLWDALARATRLYEDDPAEAWWQRVEQLGERADVLNKLRFDALHYSGPGTDLTVGLNPRGLWQSARFETAWGQRHVPNLPTEEVFTSPDYRRTEGVVTSTRPLHLPSAGVTVRDLKVRFQGGKVVDVEASSGKDVVKGELEMDAQAPYLGEVALVDKSSAVGQTGVVFAHTLFDENATCHIAYGTGFSFCLDGGDGLDREGLLEAGVNHSRAHTDFMIGGPELQIDGITPEGERVSIIAEETWQL